jgi:cytochrome c1
VKKILRWLVVGGIILFISALAGAVKIGITIIIFVIIGAILFWVAKKSYNRNRRNK